MSSKFQQTNQNPLIDCLLGDFDVSLTPYTFCRQCSVEMILSAMVSGSLRLEKMELRRLGKRKALNSLAHGLVEVAVLSTFKGTCSLPIEFYKSEFLYPFSHGTHPGDLCVNLLKLQITA